VNITSFFFGQIIYSEHHFILLWIKHKWPL
jgi:hypothetical protein